MDPLGNKPDKGTANVLQAAAAAWLPAPAAGAGTGAQIAYVNPSKTLPKAVTRTPQLPVRTPQRPSNRDQKALKSGRLGGAGKTETLHTLGFQVLSESLRGALKNHPRLVPPLRL